MTTNNGFTEGLILDTHVYQARNTILIDALNIRLITLDGDEVILQSADSNKETLGKLTTGFIPIGTETYNGICYIISAKFDANDKFIEGEIGTYPTPDYSNGFRGTDDVVRGSIINEYKPLQNYKATYNPIVPGNDVSALTGVLGDFRSDLFNFSINNPCEIEIQPFYDGTVNIIFTDNRNEIRNINSRFVVKANNRYEIIDRVGTDSNLYNAESFETTINHIQKSNNLVNVEFLGSNNQQGQLLPGNYQYYWYYETEDGNKTDVVFESFTCSIYEGSTTNELKGLSFNNTLNSYNKTTKTNQFELDNLDIAYPILKCIYTYSSGKENSLVTAYRIVNDYRITSANFVFTHFGFEEQDIIDENELSVTNATIATARTMCQLNNRLFIANVKQREYDDTQLKSFARNIRVEAKTDKTIAQDLANTNDVTEFYNLIPDVINQGGYMNNKNIYYRMGYWSSESYMLGIVYVMDNGTESVVYPVRSGDYFKEISTDVVNLDVPSFATNGYSTTDVNRANINGLIRTQHRLESTDKSIYERGLTTDAEININVMYLEFDLSIAFKENKDKYPLNTIGFKLVRSERKKDAICQGYLINTIPVPLDNSNENQLNLYHVNLNGNTWKIKENCKLIPALNYTLEGILLHPAAGGGGFQLDGTGHYITPFKFADYYTGGNSTGGANADFKRGENLAFYSTDVILNEEEYGQLFYSNTCTLHKLYTLKSVNSKINITYAGTVSNPVNIRNWSYLSYHKPYVLIKNKVVYGGLNNAYSRVKVQADFCPGDLDQYNNLGFTSITQFYGKTGNEWVDSKEGFAKFPLSFESYVGIKVDKDYTPDILIGASGILYNVGGDEFTGNGGGLGSITTGIEGTVQKNVGNTDYLNNNNDGDAFKIVTQSTDLNNNGSSGFTGKRHQTYTEIHNIYNGSGIRTYPNLKEIYNPAYEVYFPITNKMYWSQAIADKNKATLIYGNSATKTVDGENNSAFTPTYDRTFEGRTTNILTPTVSDRKLKVFRGDCFIGLCNKRLFLNNKDSGERLGVDDTGTANVDESKENKANIGYTIGIIVESNQNPYLRNTDLVDINEERTRSFIPEYTTKDANGSLTDISFGLSNSWRFYRQPETQAYNKGYSVMKGFKNQFALVNNPFIGNRFPTRIYYSDQYVNNTFENKLRYFNPLNYKDYSAHLGEIVRILTDDNSIICIHEHGTEVIPISQRTAVGQDLAGQVFIDSLGVLADPSNTQILSDFYGSKWQWSIIKTNNHTYAVDVDRERIWRFSGGMEMISEFKIQRFINAIFDKYKNQLLNIKKLNVKTYFDYKTTDVYFVFYSSGVSGYSGVGTSYVVFEELAYYVNNLLVSTVPNTVDNPNYIAPFVGTCPVTLEYPKCGVGEFWNGTECELSGVSTILDVLILTSTNNLGDNDVNGVNGTLLTNIPSIQVIKKFYQVFCLTPFVFINQNLTTSVFFNTGDLTFTQNTELRAEVEFIYQGNTYTSKYYQFCTNLNGSANSYDAFNFSFITVNTTTKKLISNTFPFLTVPANSIGSYATTTITSPSGVPTVFTKTGIDGLSTLAINYSYTVAGLYKIEDIAFNNNIVRQSRTYFIIVRDGSVGEYFGRKPKCITYDTTYDTIIFNETLKMWTTKSSVSPIEMFNVYDRLHSFNLIENTEKIWEHHLQPLDTLNQEQYSNYYGKQYPTEIEYVVGTDDINVHKVYDNIKIMGNSEVPLQITYNNDEQVNIQEDVVTRVEGNLFQANHRYLENHHYLVIGKNVPQIPTSDRRIRDKYTRFRIKYRGNKKVIITSIQTEVRPSYT